MVLAEIRVVFSFELGRIYLPSIVNLARRRFLFALDELTPDWATQFSRLELRWVIIQTYKTVPFTLKPVRGTETPHDRAECGLIVAF